MASALVFLAIPLPSFADDFYKWTDPSGGIHFSDSIEGIPEPQRHQVQGGFFEENIAPSPTQQHKNDPSNLQQKESDPSRPKSSAIDYVAFEGETSRVIIEVTFNDRVTVPMVLDTGAGEVVISEQLAAKLDLFDGEQAQFEVSVSGFGGTAPAIRTILDSMSMGELRQDFIPTRVVPELSRHFYGVIGMNFMSNFQIRIDPVRRKVIFEPLPNKTRTFAGRNKRWWQRYFSEFTRSLDRSKRQVEKIEQFLYENKLAILKIRRAAKKALSDAKGQYTEAQKLLNQLNRHATQNAVPMSWRRSR